MQHLIVKNREGIVFEGDVDNITSYNKVGVFDILQDHANFISVVEKKIIFQQRGATREITLDNGLLKARENNVWLYLGIK